MAYPSSSSSALFLLEIYRVCFALNNMGVRLLELGHYRDATVTYHEAVSALQSLAASQKQHQQQDHFSAVMETLRCNLQKASRRVAKHEHASTIDTTNMCAGHVEVLPIDHGDLAGLRGAQQYGPSSTMVFPIRFRSLVTLDAVMPTNQAGLDWEIAAVLYNYALANLLSFQCTAMEKQLSAAARLLRFTASVLLSKKSSSSSSSKTSLSAFSSLSNQDTESERAMANILLKYLVLSSLSTVFCFQKKIDKANKLQAPLSRLERRASKLESRSSTIGNIFSHSEFAARAA